MNKPLKNSEWKSNCASSYYWITSLWKPEADLSSDSTLNLHAAVGARPFPWADTVFYLSVSFVVITFHHRHMWAILQPWTQKTWLGHVSSPLTLQGRWHPPEDMQDTDKPRGEGQGKASKPSEGKRSREVFEAWSLSLSTFSLKLRTLFHAQCSLSFLVVCSHRDRVSSVPRVDRTTLSGTHLGLG